MKAFIYLPFPPITIATRVSGINIIMSRDVVELGRECFAFFFIISAWQSKRVFKTFCNASNLLFIESAFKTSVRPWISGICIVSSKKTLSQLNIKISYKRMSLLGWTYLAEILLIEYVLIKEIILQEEFEIKYLFLSFAVHRTTSLSLFFWLTPASTFPSFLKWAFPKQLFQTVGQYLRLRAEGDKASLDGVNARFSDDSSLRLTKELKQRELLTIYGYQQWTWMMKE